MKIVDMTERKGECRAFVLQTWQRSYGIAHETDAEPRNVIAGNVQRLFELAYDNTNTVCLLAEHDGVFVGWSLAATDWPGGVALYCYVKSPFRRLGVARKLLEASRPCQYFALSTEMGELLRMSLPSGMCQAHMPHFIAGYAQ